jgi:hypothetical protein
MDEQKRGPGSKLMKKTRCSKGRESNIKRIKILKDNELHFLATNILLRQPTTGTIISAKIPQIAKREFCEHTRVPTNHMRHHLSKKKINQKKRSFAQQKVGLVVKIML